MSHKKHHNTPYEAWKNVEGLEYILNPYLREALLVKKEGKWELDSNLPIFNPHILLQIRPDCLIWGGKPGSVTSWNIRKSGSDARFDAVRHQVRRMYLQTWMFSAEKRNKYMIADPFNWDTLPELLEDAVQHCEEPEQNPLDTDINWEEDWI